jgi:hypothetical protein
METRRFPGMEEFRPEPPKISDDAVALKIATAIFHDVNIEDCYWAEDEAESIINQMAEMIIEKQSVLSLFWHLKRKQQPIDCKGTRPDLPWGYEGVQNYPESMLKVIAEGVIVAELQEYANRYGFPDVKADEGTSDDENVRNT